MIQLACHPEGEVVTLAQPDPPGASSPAELRPQGPTVLRIALGTQLRRRREASGITREAAGHLIRGSYAKISRLELGRVGFKERDVADLLTLYGVTDVQEREECLALARQANQPGWWHRYSDVLPGWFEMYLGLEQASSVIRSYEPQFVPGLLQAEDGARAVIMLNDPSVSTEEIDRRVALRMKRQDVLTQPDAPSLWAVVDEAALWRCGARVTMRAQIQHLLEMAELPNVSLQVVPFRSGGYAAAGGPFTILRFSQADLPDIVYLEQLTGAFYQDKPQDVSHYLMVADRLCVQAPSPAETSAFLDRMIKEI